jgi:hypothetical protein
MKIADGLEILHCTSDILGISEKEKSLEITLFGDRDLQGEIVFEGANVEWIKIAIIDGEEVELTRDKKRVAISYRHKHRQEINLKLNIYS